MHIIYICNDQLLLHYTAKFGKEHMQKQRKNNKKHTGGLRNHNFGKTKNTWEETKTKTKIKQQKHGKKQRTFQKFWGWGRVTTSLNSYFFPKFIFVFFEFEIPTLVFPSLLVLPNLGPQGLWTFILFLYIFIFSPILLAAKFGVIFQIQWPRIRRNGG